MKKAVEAAGVYYLQNRSGPLHRVSARSQATHGLGSRSGRHGFVANAAVPQQYRVVAL